MDQHNTRTNMKRMCISTCGVVLWNGLVENVKRAINVEQFKNMYKIYIFQGIQVQVKKPIAEC